VGKIDGQNKKETKEFYEFIRKIEQFLILTANSLVSFA
jgi:hypothetical protein